MFQGYEGGTARAPASLKIVTTLAAWDIGSSTEKSEPAWELETTDWTDLMMGNFLDLKGGFGVGRLLDGAGRPLLVLGWGNVFFAEIDLEVGKRLLGP